MHRVVRLFPFRRRVPLGEQLSARYERSSQGQVIIPICLPSIETMLTPFERFSLAATPSHNPHLSDLNLNPELVDYLFRRLAEIDHEVPLLRLQITNPMANDSAVETHAVPLSPLASEQALQGLIHQYFTYLANSKGQNLQRLVRDSILMSLLGFGALALSIFLESLPPSDYGGLSISLLAQGVTVFGWLTLWEGCVNFLWTWQPIYRQLRMCQQMQQAKIELKL